MNVFIALILGHFLGDFVFQSDGQVAQKRHRDLGARTRFVCSHAAVVGITMLALASLAAGGVSWEIALLVFLLAALHAVQDVAKETLALRRTLRHRTTWLLVDQALHLIIIAALTSAFGFHGPFVLLRGWILDLRRTITLESALIFIVGTWVAGIILKEALSLIAPAQAISQNSEPSSGKTRPGDGPDFEQVSFWIGIVERIIVITSITMGGRNGLATVGLVVAAKSVYRWRELDEAKAAQYFLLGTLASVAMGVVDGLVLRHLGK